MKKFDELEWRKFRIDELFDVQIGKNVDGNKIDKTSGKFAYITRKESNNGLDGFISCDTAFLNVKYPVITIGNETSQPFVQAFPFFTGTKVNILTPKCEVSRNALLFIARCLNMHKNKYSYAYTINSTRLKQQIILLPAALDGSPDYAFMESYMQQVEAKLLRQYMNSLHSR